MYWYGDHGTWWGWLLMSLGTVVFWGLIIVGLVMLVRSLGNNARSTWSGPVGPPPVPPAPRPTPEQILAERLARGEIDAAEYAKLLDTLHGKTPQFRP